MAPKANSKVFTAYPVEKTKNGIQLKVLSSCRPGSHETASLGVKGWRQQLTVRQIVRIIFLKPVHVKFEPTKLTQWKAKSNKYLCECAYLTSVLRPF